MEKRAHRPKSVRDSFEVLESRVMMSAAPAASTVHDGGGTQVLTSVQSGQTYQHYLVRAPLNVGGTTGVTITNCDIGNISGNAILPLGSATNLTVSNNTFHDISGTGIYSNGHATIIGSHFDANTFNNVKEPIHLDFGQSGSSGNVTVNDNYITNYSRIGIELQWIVNGLQVNHNYITNRINTGKDEGGLMAISCATGSATGLSVDTHNVEIAYNTLVGPAWANQQVYAAIESMGSGANVHNNYISDWCNGVIWAWTATSGPVAWNFTNNTFVGVTTTGYCEGYGPNLSPTTTGNVFYALNAANAPAAPSVAATTSGTTPSPTTTPAPTPTATPTFTATAASDGVHLSLPAGGGTLTWTATGGAGTPLASPTSNQTNTMVIPAGATSYVDTSVPSNWEVYYTFSGSPSGVLVTAASQPSVSTPAPAPAPPPTVTPAPTPTVTPTATLTATAAPDGVHLTLPAGGGTLTWVATGGSNLPLSNPTSAQTHSTVISAATTSFVDTSVPNNWRVYYTFSGAAGQGVLVTMAAAQVVSSGPTTPVTTPVVSGTPASDGSPVSAPLSTPVGSGPTSVTAAGWADADLGSTVSAGSSSETGGVFTVDSPVADTTQSPVATDFVYQTLGQNGSITVKVGAVQGTAGLKLTSGLESDDPTASLLTDANGNITFTTQGATSASSASGIVEAKGDTWLRLVRSGGRVLAYASANGTSWQRIGSAYLNLPNSVEVGMAVASQTNGASGTAQFSNVAVAGNPTKTVASIPKVSADEVVAAAPAIGTGNGLTAQMYSNVTRTGKAMTQTDASVDFNWGQGTPDSSISSTPYSVRWTGKVQAEYSDVYTLSVNSDTGVKLFVNGKAVIHDWQNAAAGTKTADVAMEAGKKYHLRLVYGEKGNSDSNVSLGWSSTRQAPEIIPQSQLFAEAA